MSINYPLFSSPNFPIFFDDLSKHKFHETLSIILQECSEVKEYQEICPGKD
jgi:hypothetical protein